MNAVEWLERIELFGIQLGLERMQALMDRLSHPERRFRAIHVLGTNGKTTVTRTAEALLLAEGVSAGAFTSPHVTDWAERIRVGGREADFERAIERVRPAAEELGATQFEVLTAAALAEFADAGVEVAVIEAGLGGRLDATNVLGAPVVVLTNVALEHTAHLGSSREQIAREKLAVVRPGANVVLGEPEWRDLCEARSAGRIRTATGNAELAHAAVEELLDRPVDRAPALDVRVPGRLEVRGEAPLEIWDGAHNPAGVTYLLTQLPAGDDWTLALSISEDKDADTMLAALSVLGERVVATQSHGLGRPIPAEELAARARRRFPVVEAVPDPLAARERALELAGSDGAVLVTGSLYLLASLNAVRSPDVRWGG
jgi:dihydrofolate synthase / folylpolyglutamate synthase